MDVLNCPTCGTRNRIPQVETNERYYCVKCQTTFHLTASRAVVEGDPSNVERDVEELKQKIRQTLERVPVRRIVLGLVALVVVFAVSRLLLRPAPGLGGPGEQAAQALAAGDRASLAALAAPGTADDVARWFDEIYPRLEQEREGWFGQEEVVKATVAAEDHDRGRGIVGISIHPNISGTRGVMLADPEAAAAVADPFETVTVWTPNRWGNWKLDGEATLEATQPTP